MTIFLLLHSIDKLTNNLYKYDEIFYANSYACVENNT